MKMSSRADLLVIYIIIMTSFVSVTISLDDYGGSDEHLHIQDEDKLTVILSFPYLFSKEAKQHYPGLSYSDMDRRMEEFISCLQSTLLHSQVRQVYLLYDDDDLPEYVNSMIFANKENLHFHKVQNSRQVSFLFRFAFSRFRHQLVMINQADNYPKFGFHLLKKSRLSKLKLLYALTRHGRLEDSCEMQGEFCDRKTYVGSHDAYIFVPQGRLTARALSHLNTRSTNWGIDLLIVWVFEKVLKYRVLNPCKVIFIYHRHCSFVRDAKRGRINTLNTTGWAEPTDNLI